MMWRMWRPKTPIQANARIFLMIGKPRIRGFLATAAVIGRASFELRPKNAARAVGVMPGTVVEPQRPPHLVCCARYLLVASVDTTFGNHYVMWGHAPCNALP